METTQASMAHALPPSLPGAGGSLLRCREEGPVLVHGPRSGRAYRFSPSAPVQVVDRQDFDALLGTGLFQRA